MDAANGLTKTPGRDSQSRWTEPRRPVQHQSTTAYPVPLAAASQIDFGNLKCWREAAPNCRCRSLSGPASSTNFAKSSGGSNPVRSASALTARL